MINPDNLKSGQIQRKLRAKEFKDGAGNRKNYGLTSLTTHVKECRVHSNRTQSSSSSSNAPSTQSTPAQSLISRFAYNKNQLPEHLKTQLKDAELKFVTAGSHSFNALENNGVLDLIQTSIDIGAQMGKVDVRDIFYGRKTIRSEAMVKINHFTAMIRRILDEPIENHCIAATCDIWTDDYVKRSYLDFSVF